MAPLEHIIESPVTSHKPRWCISSTISPSCKDFPMAAWMTPIRFGARAHVLASLKGFVFQRGDWVIIIQEDCKLTRQVPADLADGRGCFYDGIRADVVAQRRYFVPSPRFRDLSLSEYRIRILYSRSSSILWSRSLTQMLIHRTVELFTKLWWFNGNPSADF